MTRILGTKNGSTLVPSSIALNEMRNGRMADRTGRVSGETRHLRGEPIRRPLEKVGPRTRGREGGARRRRRRRHAGVRRTEESGRARVCVRGHTYARADRRRRARRNGIV